MDASRLDRMAVDLRALLLALANDIGEHRHRSRKEDERADELERAAKLARGMLADVDEARHAKR